MRETLHDFIAIQVKAGFEARESIIQEALEFLRDLYDHDMTATEVTGLVDDLLAQHYQTQRAWTHETDCDRLDEAFAELDRHGILARQNFTCCQTCGHAEIGEAIDDVLEYRPVRGYVFYHQQDTEAVVEGGYLYLAYGAVDGKEDASVAVGFEIVAALERAGLTVEWSGSILQRICVQDIVWQRRRLPEAILAL